MNGSVVVVTSKSDRAEANLLIGLHNKGLQMVVFSHPDAPFYQDLVKSGLEVVPLIIKGKFDFSASNTIRSYLIERNAHILHVFNNKALFNGIRASKGLHNKIIAYRGVVGNISFFNPYSWLTYLHPRVTRVMCVSEAIRSFFLNMSFLGMRLPEKKFTTIYKGHDIHWYTKTMDCRSELNIPEKAFVVGTIANMRPRNTKGIPELIQSTHYLNDKEIYFVIIGKLEKKHIQGLIEHSPVRDRIILTGYRKDAAAMIGSFDAYVLPSVKPSEGLPKSVIEAMAQGVTPIVTNAGGSPELISDMEDGLIISPGDPRSITNAIVYLKENPDKRQDLGFSAQKTIQNQFNVFNTIENTYQMYADVL